MLWRFFRVSLGVIMFLPAVLFSAFSFALSMSSVALTSLQRFGLLLLGLFFAYLACFSLRLLEVRHRYKPKWPAFPEPPDLPEDHTCPVPKPTPPPHRIHPEAKEIPKG